MNPLYASPKSAQTSLARSAAFVEQLTKPSRDRRKVAVTLSWPGGGNSVSLVGSFTNWTERVPMVAASPLEEGNTHFVTVHLCAGEYQYCFEVDGVFCVTDEKPMAINPTGRGQLVNIFVVDDGSEYEELGGKAAGPESPTQIYGEGTAPSWSARADTDGFSTSVPINLKVARDEPPPLPQHLFGRNGVPQTAASRRTRRIIWPEGRPHAVSADCELNHGAFAHCGANEGFAGSGVSPEQGLPTIQRGRQATTISVSTRWRAHRVTNVLLKPTPARTELHSEITLRRTTLGSTSAAIESPQPYAAPLLCLSYASSAPPDNASMGEPGDFPTDNESMDESGDSPLPSPPLPFERMMGRQGAALVDGSRRSVSAQA
ncbi:hypothetical protein T492DRAFT_1147516 [Pavlovales sp. CCMP2436]|nr:hypothetical protein T492DRAFT_1147516 [Pavlovales sp. CCMP2436]|mmetsp:Transcript_13468/g.31836  ORF Transcript_13468/g.31836 Transcript_13468/m.31836 type:complete len:374 (+) Transcript_13468:49-1170(+)